MEIKCTIHDLQFTRNGQQILSLAVQGDFRPYYDKLDGKELNAKITQFKPKRSINANDYCWQLCTKLAEAAGTTKEEVYRNAIKAVGIFKDFPNMSQDDAKTLRTAWEMLGTGWVTEQVDFMPDGENVIVRCYYGSSRYNTRQMSRLIDNIVQDCKAVGIETKTPAELARLCEEWQ